ncbi:MULTISPECIES: hypothetical protein [Weissella]|jgi:hypothetical protein|uniref:Uncharacterized protein n=1 Tax=Weissella fermenti TaxID=2987699 RepID=A0ABT6D5L6_9LACO|nr:MULTISPECIES: hypothetical protein [Weissella]MDF9300815.1 hypothetical protein [Weissella sp. BK2]
MMFGTHNAPLAIKPSFGALFNTVNYWRHFLSKGDAIFVACL